MLDLPKQTESMVDPPDVTDLAVEVAKQLWAMVEAFRGNKKAIPDLFWSVQDRSAQIGAALQLRQLSAEADSGTDQVVVTARAALEEARDLIFEFVLAYSPTRFTWAPEYQERIETANKHLGDVMVDLHTNDTFINQQDVLHQWIQGQALPGAARMHRHGTARPGQSKLLQLPKVPATYNLEVIKSMARLAKQDREEQLRALLEVVSLTGASAEGRLQVAAAGIVPMLVKLLREGVDSLKSGAVRALANLCQEHAPAASVLAAGAVPLLVQYVQGGPMANMGAQAQLQAAEKVMKLVYRGSLFQDEIAGALKSDRVLQERAERAILFLSYHGPMYRSAIVSAGVVLPLMQLLKSPDQAVQAAAMHMLDSLSIRGPESLSALVSAGASAALSQWLEGLVVDSQDATEIPPLQAEAALLIARLACPGQETDSIIPIIVDLLDHMDANIQLQAAQAIALLWQECPQHHSALDNAGALPRLAGHLENGRLPAVQCAGANSLASIFTNGPAESQANIRAKFAIYALLGALRSSDAELQKCAAVAVAKLSEWSADLRHSILATGTIAPLLELLTSMDEGAQRAASQVLQNLPCDAEHTLRLIQERKDTLLEQKLTELAVDPGRHEGCVCRVCVKSPFSGRRYLCKVCPVLPGYDVCGCCKRDLSKLDTPRIDDQHSPVHEMMLTVSALQIVKAAEEAGVSSQNLTEELTQLLVEAIGCTQLYDINTMPNLLKTANPKTAPEHSPKAAVASSMQTYGSEGQEQALSLSEPRAEGLSSIDEEDMLMQAPELASTFGLSQDVATLSLNESSSPSQQSPSAIDLAVDLAALVRQLKGTDKLLQERAARALLDRAYESPEHVPAILAAGAVPHLVALLGGLEQHPQASALWALTNPPSTDPGQVPFKLSPDTLPTLSRLLEGHKDDVQELRVTLLDLLVRGSEGEQAQALQRVVELTGASAINGEEAANAGMVPALLDLLRGGGGVDVKRGAAQALANLCVDPAPAASVVAAKGIPLLVHLIKGDELQVVAAQALLNLTYSSPEHLYAIASAGGIPPLVRLLMSEDKELQREAARLAAYLCQRSHGYQSSIVSAGAIPLLVRLVKGRDTDLQATAACSIGYLAHQLFDFRSVISAAGAVPALVRLLYSSDEDVQRFGAWALASMAELSHTQQSAIAALGAVPPLVRLLSSTNKDVQEMATRAIACLSDWSPAHRFTIVSAGAIPSLVQLLDSPNKGVQEEAARALAYLWTPEDQPGAATLRGIPFLKELLKGVGKQVKEEAVRALEGLSGMGWAERYFVARTEGIPGLKWLLASTNSYLQARAAHDISCLPHWLPTCQSAIISEDAIAPLVRLLESMNKEVQARAARAVAKLSNSGPELCSAIVSAGAKPPLERLLESADVDVQKQAELALGNLAAGTPEQMPTDSSMHASQALALPMKRKGMDLQVEEPGPGESASQTKAPSKEASEMAPSSGMSWWRAWRSGIPGEHVELQKLTDEEAYECWLEDEPEARGKQDEQLKKAWKRWLWNKVFVRNKSGEDVIAYVQRSNTEKIIKSLEVGSGGGPTGGSVFVRLEFELSKHRLQKGLIKAEKQEQGQQSAKKRLENVEKNVMFEVGGGAHGAYITVMLEKDPMCLFCLERAVPCGFRLVVTRPTFLDPPAVAAVAAAAPRVGGDEGLA